MVAEDRAWWMKRIDRQRKEEAEREKNQAGSISKPTIPRMPRR